MPHAQNLRLPAVHPLHGLTRTDRALEYVDVVDRYFRDIEVV